MTGHQEVLIQAWVLFAAMFMIGLVIALMLHSFYNRKKRMGTVTINGKTYTGNNISIRGNQVIIDGKVHQEGVSGVVEVRIIEGTVNKLESDASITCGDVAGHVSAGGSVSCEAVSGNVSAGGSVSCDNVGGNIAAGGSVRHG